MKLTVLLISAALAGSSIADDPAKPADPAASPAQPDADIVFKPTELAALQVVLGKRIIVSGNIVAAGANKTESIRYLNFTKNYRDSVTLVFHTITGGGTFTKQRLAGFVGKNVRVNGVLTERNGAFQIKIESLDQIKVQP